MSPVRFHACLMGDDNAGLTIGIFFSACRDNIHLHRGMCLYLILFCLHARTGALHLGMELFHETSYAVQAQELA